MACRFRQSAKSKHACVDAPHCFCKDAKFVSAKLFRAKFFKIEFFEIKLFKIKFVSGMPRCSGSSDCWAHPIHR